MPATSNPRQRVYEVLVQLTKTVTFHLEAGSEEEAEDAAAELADTGEDDFEVDVLDSFPVDDDATGFV